METRLRLLLVVAGLPRPEVQVDICDDRGRFIARVDLYYPAKQLCIEYDGTTHRFSLVRDDERQNRLVEAGYSILRFTAPDIANPARVVALVRGALSAPTNPRISAEIWPAAAQQDRISREIRQRGRPA